METLFKVGAVLGILGFFGGFGALMIGIALFFATGIDLGTGFAAWCLAATGLGVIGLGLMLIAEVFDW